MIEFLAFLGIFCVNYLTKNLDTYPLIISFYISIAITYIIIANFFIALINNFYHKQKNRYAWLCACYTVLIAVGITASFYFSYIYVKNIILIALYIAVSLPLIYLIYLSFKSKKTYGSLYLFFRLAYIAIIIGLLMLDFFNSYETVNDTIINIYFVFIGCLYFLQYIVERFKKYWKYNISLFNKLEVLMDKNNTDKAIIPPIREVENDFILSDLRYILQESFVRSIEIIRITKKLRKIMYKKSVYNQKQITDFTNEFMDLIIHNLMNRKNDYSFKIKIRKPNTFIRKKNYKDKRKS